jgi:glycosyltransferase involved in cell wall biosynthesis
MPLYNGAAFLAATIESVLAQTWEDWELVIADDASSDGSLDVVRRFADCRIRILDACGKVGAAANWNRAVAEARGRYVKVLCQDDLIYPTCLAEQIAVFERDAENAVAFVCARRDIIDSQGRVVFRNRGHRWAGRVAGSHALRALVRSGTNPLGEPATVLFRQGLYHTTSGFRGPDLYMIDVDFWCQLLIHGNLYALPRTLAAFRVSDRSLSASIGLRQAVQARRFFQRLGTEHPGIVRRTDVIRGCMLATILGLARGMIFQAAHFGGSDRCEAEPC